MVASQKTWLEEEEEFFCGSSTGDSLGGITTKRMDPDYEKRPRGPKTEQDGVPYEPEDYNPHVVVGDKLDRKLTARQVQMIAIGGTIGTGLFLGTGSSLATGGPASMLISYAIVGAIVFVTMLSLGEMAAFIPVAGSFCTFAG